MNKKIAFLLVLCMVSLLAFSGVTYAGFSKQNNPKVDNLQFTVATQENMMISTSGLAGTFKDNIAFSDLVDGDVTLSPVKGVVTENSISLYHGEYVASSSSYIKFTLYFSGSNDMDVYLAGSTSGTVIDPIEVSNNMFTSEQIAKMVDSLRIGFVSYTTREIPTSSGIEISYSPIDSNVYSLNEKTNESYKNGLPYDTFSNIGYTAGIKDDVVLLNVRANKINKMDIYLWVESEDINCDESLFNVLLKVNLRFEAVKNESGGAS